ncbi:MAG: hypothetical protein V1792_11185 [Pseudomonadota bacterium]
MLPYNRLDHPFRHGIAFLEQSDELALQLTVGWELSTKLVDPWTFMCYQQDGLRRVNRKEQPFLLQA